MRFYGFFYAIENLLGYDALFTGKLLALVTDILEAPAVHIQGSTGYLEYGQQASPESL
jgi:hypothetical protein